jgi:hypothetical protein
VKRYVALTESGHNLVTVIAEDEAEAREKIRHQLDRPGRRQFYARWREGGEQIKEK